MQSPPPSEAESLWIVEVHRNGLEILDAEECERLLASSTFGRIGVTHAASPRHLPINYRYVDGRIVFRMAAGRSSRRPPAAPSSRSRSTASIRSRMGWSVIVTGVASPVTDVDGSTHATAAVPRWAPFGRTGSSRCSLQLVSGRRLEPRAQPSGDAA